MIKMEKNIPIVMNSPEQVPPHIGFTTPGNSAPYPVAPPSYEDITSQNQNQKTFQNQQYPQLFNDPQVPQTTQIITSK